MRKVGLDVTAVKFRKSIAPTNVLKTVFVSMAHVTASLALPHKTAVRDFAHLTADHMVNAMMRRVHVILDGVVFIAISSIVLTIALIMECVTMVLVGVQKDSKERPVRYKHVTTHVNTECAMKNF